MAQITIYGGERSSPREIKLFNGHGPPSHIEGAIKGDLYIDVDTGDLYQLEEV